MAYFPSHYFAPHYFAPHYFSDSGSTPPPPTGGYRQIISSDQSVGAPLGFTLAMLVAVLIPLFTIGA